MRFSSCVQLCVFVCMVCFSGPQDRTRPPTGVTGAAENRTHTQSVRLEKPVLPPPHVSHLGRFRASTRGVLRRSGSWQRSKVGRGVGGSVAESVVSVGSHRALCSDSSWLRWSLEKLVPQARRRYDKACCLNSFTWTGAQCFNLLPVFDQIVPGTTYPLQLIWN